MMMVRYLTTEEFILLCGLLTTIVAATVFLDPRSRRVRLAIWWSVILVSLGSIALTMHKRMPHSNLAHYYLGSKYKIDYADFYSVLMAAKGEAQIGFRDLKNPNDLVRTDPRAQRLYYIGLLRQYDVVFSPDASLDTLKKLVAQHGLIQREADAIVAEAVGVERGAALRKDVSYPNLFTDDFGFNGSPLVVLARRLDPTLYFPLGPLAGIMNTVWQIVAMSMCVLLLAAALGWRREHALMIMALMLCTADYSAWALVGLIAGGWMLPAVLTIWAWSKRRYMLSGLTIAWAGLIKLFPFGLILPLGIGLARSLTEPDEDRVIMRDCIRAGVACAIGVIVLIIASSWVGKSWDSFGGKIVVQFLGANYVANGVGVTKIFQALGVAKSSWAVVPQATMLFALCWVAWFRLGENFYQHAPRLALLVLSCLGWLTGTWFNYYAIVALFLLPGMLPGRRKCVAGFIALYAMSTFLPDYIDPLAPPFQFVGIIKVIPHLTLPLFALGCEIKAVQYLSLSNPSQLTQWLHAWGRRVLFVGCLLSLIAVCGDIYRIHQSIAHYERATVERALGRVDVARAYYEKSLRLLPSSAQTHFNLAAILEEQGLRDEAMRHYARALRIDAENVDARVNLAILQLEQGTAGSAIEHLTEAVSLVPYDEVIRFNYANALIAIGDVQGARRELEMALEIAPDLSAARGILQQLDAYEAKNP